MKFNVVVVASAVSGISSANAYIVSYLLAIAQAAINRRLGNNNRFAIHCVPYLRLVSLFGIHIPSFK